MSGLTPIASRLAIALDDEYRRMQNEWFFKWHFIGKDGPVEIDTFDGRMMTYGGVTFWGTTQQIYWETIQRYLRKKVGLIFDEIEQELPKYPIQTKQLALKEVSGIIAQFAAAIRRAAIEKDRILRGNGFDFPPERDRGRWEGGRNSDIESRIAGLSDIYCQATVEIEGKEMSLKSMMTDKLSLIKKDGSLFRDNIPGLVTEKQITTFAQDLPIEQGDHFLRKLPSGLVEDFVVDNPRFFGGLPGIEPHYQVKVMRSNLPAASPQAVIQNITNIFHGANSRVNIGSTDNSVNIASAISMSKISDLLEQIRPVIAALPAKQQEEIAEPLSVLEQEARQSQPSQSKIKAALQSIKAVAEGAAGNLIAAGIGAMIGQILG
ncbi:hypothetical protein FJ950_26975 [Mesorhizobium sp. B2-3-14]|uniref:hypothetical protein n=1 Tax=Mesorhizobium sp. B2-3-14 TaxID=2589950 RepID=UPI00112A2F69|nr:hypothetical protein [Mesorhizobium sp. B2-3-14]TPL79862.1 hypothetical protein FJ950_26975 [Mesorhizobium sp. B2-3-14]